MNLEIETTSVMTSLSDNHLYASSKPAYEAEKTASVFQKMLNSLNRQLWFIRLTNKEYWHPNVYFIPLGFYVFYLACRARSPFFFSAANPSIPTGGLVGEDKADISRWIPTIYRPKNIVITSATPFGTMRRELEKANMTFPLILKPTVGARGLLVQKVENLAEIQQHTRLFPTNYLVEEFIDYPVEAAVLYWKNPETGKSGITSVTLKEFLSVTGDGQSNVEELLMHNPRGVLQVPRLLTEKPDLLKSVPACAEKIVVEHIGNHCRGTKFLNFNHLITPNMVTAYDKIQSNLPDCYVFRIDLKAPSVFDLQNGLNIKILEINGVGSDPAHVFDPNFPLLSVYGAYFSLWKTIFEVSTAQHRRGVPYMTWKAFKHFSQQQKFVEQLIED